MTITWSQFAWAIGIFLAWNAFLVGIIKVLITREVARFDTRLTETDAKAAKALASTAEHKQTTTTELANMRLEFSQKGTCTNHQRMEANDKEIFQTLRQLHGDIRELCGGVKALGKSLDMVNEHLLNGGK